jgi:hypothetical protein
MFHCIQSRNVLANQHSWIVSNPPFPGFAPQIPVPDTISDETAAQFKVIYPCVCVCARECEFSASALVSALCDTSAAAVHLDGWMDDFGGLCVATVLLSPPQVNPVTVYGFFDDLQIPQGEWLLQNAAGSVLGRQVIELAKARGVKTINVVRRKEQFDELKEIGCVPWWCSSSSCVACSIALLALTSRLFAA